MNIRVAGRNRAGAQVLFGRINFNRFAVQEEMLDAIGVPRGVLQRNNRSFPVRPRQVRLPVQQINGVDLASLTESAAAADVSGQQLACEVLTLTLGPLDLNLLGLRAQLNRNNLRITAIPGGGLLGDLLCSTANLHSGGPLGNLLNQIARLLNQVLGALG